jgi:hypothetical protein
VRSGIHKHPWTFYRKITYACHNVEVGRCGRDRMVVGFMVVGFTTTYEIRARPVYNIM